MKIIDAHTHIYPDKIAFKASIGVGDFYDLKATYDGKVSTLINACENAGVSQCLVHSVATNASQVSSINSFIYETVNKYPGRFYGFATLHPHSSEKELLEHIEKAISLGLHGFKLHPDFQKFYADGKEAYNIYEIINGRLPVLIHAGDKRTEFSKPKRILNMCKAFPKQAFIAAHFGGWSEWGDCAKELSDCGIYVDTSSSQTFISPEKIRELIDIFTPSHVFFGTDYPIWNIKNEIEMLNRVLYDTTEAEQIYYKSFEQMLKNHNIALV